MFDTHAHINFNAFKDDGDEVIRKSLNQNTWMVNVGSEFRTSRRAVEYAKKYEKGVWAAVGLHPVNIRTQNVKLEAQNTPSQTILQESEDLEREEEDRREIFDYEKYLELARNEKVVAIGEVGLDYHHFEEGDDIEKIKGNQKEIFEKFIDLANEVEKPIMIHCWDAYSDILEILEKKPVSRKGVVHSFVGSYKTARLFRELGFKLGFNGIVTYSDSYNKVISDTPIEDIFIETDCPYLTPKPLVRDERNEPINVSYIAQKIANIKGLSIEEVEKITTRNAMELFGVK